MFISSLAAFGLGLSCNVEAADPVYTLNIPAKALKDALVDLVLQTNISIGGVDPAKCGGKPRALQGRFSADQAVRALIGSGQCDVQRFNATTYRLKYKLPVASIPVWPQSAPPTLGDDNVTVLVVRRPQNVTNAPLAISVISGTAMAGNDHDLADLAPRVPGMAVTNLGPGRDKILLRGISDSVLTGRTQSTVGLYLDDTPITYNAPDPDLLLADMSRIEVLKGPQGALYGQGSMSGVVRLVTNKPVLDQFVGTADIGLGGTENGEPSSREVAVLNVPLLRHRLAVRTVLYNDQSGGFIKDVNTTNHVSNTTKRSGGRLEFLWNINDNFVFTTSGLSQFLKSENSQYVSGTSGPYKREMPLAEPHDNNLENIAVSLEGETGWGTLKIALNQLHHHVFSGYDAQPLTQVVTIPNSGVLFYDEDQEITLRTQEISLVSKSAQRLRWLVGGFSAYSGERFDPHLVDVFTQSTIYNETRIDQIRDAALFGQLSYDITSKLTASAGLRAAFTDHDTSSQINHVRLTNYKKSGDVTGIIKAQRLAQTFGLSYQANPQALVYFQYGDGYRTGGFNTTTLAMTAVPTSYAGDQLDSYEAGLRYKTPDHRFRMNLSAFHVLWYNIQSDQLRSTGLPITVNLGDGVNNGLELETDWQAASHFSLHTATQLNDPKLDAPNAAFSNDANSGMPYIAKVSFSVSADWDQNLWQHVLENSAILSYRASSPINYGPLRSVRTDEFTNLDWSSGMTIGHVHYGVRLDNVTGVKSNSFAYGNPFSLTASNQITPLRPRTLWLSLGYHY